mgnify:CR=1 FL=1
MFSEIKLVTLGVKDLDRSIAFYADAFEFEDMEDGPSPFAGTNGLKATRPGMARASDFGEPVAADDHGADFDHDAAFLAADPDDLPSAAPDLDPVSVHAAAPAGAGARAKTKGSREEPAFRRELARRFRRLAADTSRLKLSGSVGTVSSQVVLVACTVTVPEPRCGCSPL